MITFYWVDNDYKESKYYHHGDNIIGIKSHNYDGEIITDVNERMDRFKASIRYLKDSSLKSLVGNIDENNITLSGVVVQGTPDKLIKLQDNKIIKHAILVTVIDRY